MPFKIECRQGPCSGTSVDNIRLEVIGNDGCQGSQVEEKDAIEKKSEKGELGSSPDKGDPGDGCRSDDESQKKGDDDEMNHSAIIISAILKSIR